MNAEEPMNLTKWAVSAMLLSLLLGITTTFFYFLYTNLSDKQSSTQDIIASASVDKFYYLEQQTKTADSAPTPQVEDYPLVSSVVNAFTELDSADILYYDIYSKNNTVRKCFVIDSGTITVANLPADAVKSTVMNTEAAKYLMSFIGNRCRVYVIDKDAAGNPLPNSLYAIQIYIIN